MLKHVYGRSSFKDHSLHSLWLGKRKENGVTLSESLRMFHGYQPEKLVERNITLPFLTKGLSLLILIVIFFLLC
jgi:hypothetical protein